MSDKDRIEFGAGQIVYAHHLHLDSINLDRDCHRENAGSQIYRYSVNGKPRPMLVIGPNGEKMHGTQWYWVLKLTTKGGDRVVARRRGYVPLGYIVDNRTFSYTDCLPHSVPENLFERVIRKDLGPGVLQSVLSVAKITLGGPRR